MTNDNGDSSFIEKVKGLFSGGSNDTEDLQDTELAAQSRGEGAGDVSGTEADVNMFDQSGDPTAGTTAAEKAQPGTGDSGRAVSSYESVQPGAGFADTGSDPYANTPGTGFATGAIPTTIPAGADSEYDSDTSGLSTEPSLGEGDAGAVGAPVGEDVSLEERSGI